MKYVTNFAKQIWPLAILLLVLQNAVFAQMQPSDDCVNAPFFSNSMMNGLQSQTNLYSPSDVDYFCGSIEKDQWIRVKADSTTSTISITPSDCADGNGIQLAIYSDCDGPFIACNVGCSGCGELPQTITANLVSGNYYYVLIDGWGGDFCDFTMSASGFADIGLPDQDSFAIIKGRLSIDLIQNCQTDASEPGLQHWLVELLGTYPTYAMTNALGEYALYTNAMGNNELVLHKPSISNIYWDACEDTVTVNVPALLQTVTADFQVNKLIDCPTNTFNAAIKAIGRRPCEPVFIKGFIENYGNFSALSVPFEVVLDPILIVDSTEFPILYQFGDTLGFEIGPINYNQKKSFRIYCHLPCDPSLVNRSFCNELIVYGSSDCDTIINWSGAGLSVEGNCDTSTQQVIFLIKNRGTAATTEPLPYVVIEDEVILRDGFVPVGLQPNQSFQIAEPALGQTFILQVDQEPNHPGLDVPTVFVEGCNGPITQSYVNQMPHNDANPEIDIDCQTISYSYDPNEKSAVPNGLTSNWHLVEPFEEIEYTVDFQNTGTDTAFSVIIRDTISDLLDLTTFTMMGASHDFDYEIYGSGILKVWFPQIRLVDSLTNEHASKGYFTYRIAQKKDIEFYTQIFNRAAIYFDINPPIFTNLTWHTIGYGLWQAEVSDIGKAGEKSLKINVMPNPFSEKTTIQMMPAPDGWKVLRVFTPDGRTCRTIKFDAEKVELTRAGLPDGLLFFYIEKDGAVLAAGKLLPK